MFGRFRCFRSEAQRRGGYSADSGPRSLRLTPSRLGGKARVVLGIAVVAGATIASVPFAGSASGQPSWSTPTSIDPGNGGNPLVVSCPTVNSCMAVDINGNAMTYNGTRWSTPTRVDSGGGGFSSLSCVTAQFCAAVDYAGNALIYNGTSWSTPVLIDQTESALVSVSCATTNFYVAIDANGNAFTYDGAFNPDGFNWSAPTSFDARNTPIAVSCPAANFCMAVDYNGNASIYNGTSWSAPTRVDSNPGGLSSVSCVATTTCAAVDFEGNALNYAGGTWLVTPGVDSNGLDSVSCATSSFCVAIDGGGNTVTYNGTSWSALTDVDSSNSLAWVSCAGAQKTLAITQAASFCGAGDYNGNALVYSGAASLSAATVTQAYSSRLTATGGNAPYTWTLASGHLPRGLHLNRSTGTITGKPSKRDRGTYTFTVKVVDKRVKVKHLPATRNTATTPMSIAIS